jgi:hypothetical protein
LGVAGATSSGDNSGYRRFPGAAGGQAAGGGVAGRRGRHLGRGWPASGAGGAELRRRGGGNRGRGADGGEAEPASVRKTEGRRKTMPCGGVSGGRALVAPRDGSRRNPTLFPYLCCCKIFHKTWFCLFVCPFEILLNEESLYAFGYCFLLCLLHN